LARKNITRVDLTNSVKYSFILYNIMYNILFIWENYYFQYINLKMYLIVVQNMLEFKKKTDYIIYNVKKVLLYLIIQLQSDVVGCLY